MRGVGGRRVFLLWVVRLTLLFFISEIVSCSVDEGACGFVAVNASCTLGTAGCLELAGAGRGS